LGTAGLQERPKKFLRQLLVEELLNNPKKYKIGNKKSSEMNDEKESKSPLEEKVIKEFSYALDQRCPTGIGPRAILKFSIHHASTAELIKNHKRYKKNYIIQ